MNRILLYFIFVLIFSCSCQENPLKENKDSISNNIQFDVSNKICTDSIGISEAELISVSENKPFNINLKNEIGDVIEGKKDRFGLKDYNTFLSYIPDSIDDKSKTDPIIREKIKSKIISRLPDLAERYRKYDFHINRKGSSGVIDGALEYLTTDWYFKSTFKVPKSCLGADSIRKCWELPSDFIGKESSVITGMPYCWGGKDIFDDFNSKILKGYAPGDICGIEMCKGICNCPLEKNTICKQGKTTGIDCSGLIVNSFIISKDIAKYGPIISTMSLATNGKFNWIGKNVNDLKRGDLLLFPGHHVAICTKISVAEDICEVIHSSPANFFNVGVKLDGLNQGVRLDRGNIQNLKIKLNKGFGIYRFATYEHTYVDFDTTLRNLILSCMH